MMIRHGSEKFSRMQEDHAEQVNQYIKLPETPLTKTLKSLQELFPNMNTAIIDRAVITCKGDFDCALEKLLQISARFS